MISTIQIQTIDACNLNCIMCPRKYIFQTKEILKCDSIREIAEKINCAQEKGYVKLGVRIILNFENEPFLDVALILKIKILKEICDCNIDFYTNGLLAHTQKNELIEISDLMSGIIYSNYGDNRHDWEIVTGVKITDIEFKRMKDTIDEIAQHMNVRRWDAWRGEKLYDFSTRAGLTKIVKVKKKVGRCEWVRPNNYINIYSNGDIVLCCQDWKHETLYGNIMQKTLVDILMSNKYKYIMDQATGKRESDKNFICKRCKFNK